MRACEDRGVEPAIAWYRRDLRLDDNPMLEAARRSQRPVVHLFAFDARLLHGPREPLVRTAVDDLARQLALRGETLVLEHGMPEEAVLRLVHATGAHEVHATGDATPFARRRDLQVAGALGDRLVLHADDVCVPHDLVGRPRTYSAYVRAVSAIGIERPAAAWEPPAAVQAFAAGGLGSYARRRDVLDDARATSRLSALLHLGVVSPRRLVALADDAGAAKWRAELLWRDWFRFVLYRHPDLAERAVDARFERIAWRDADDDFEAWCRGETGYGLVDAGMRQLAAEGFVPNRVRMVCASFLVKHLLVDWRRGERWFRRHLIDGDLASNAGNWQWVAGTGLDAAPYFRIFNPLLQERTFDPDGAYVRRYAPDRPAPIIDLAEGRARALAAYQAPPPPPPPPPDPDEDGAVAPADTWLPRSL